MCNGFALMIFAAHSVPVLSFRFLYVTKLVDATFQNGNSLAEKRVSHVLQSATAIQFDSSVQHANEFVRLCDEQMEMCNSTFSKIYAIGH